MSDIRGLFSFPDGIPTSVTESRVRVVYDDAHEVFLGHFPGRPVVPGVCLVEAATEIASTMQGKTLRLVQARAIKFLAPVDPRTTPELTFHTTLTNNGERLRIDVQAIAGEAVVMKLTGEVDTVAG